MPSQLTRLVFRRILANEPLLYRGCRHHAARPRIATHHGACTLPHIQRRSFFDLFKQRRKIKPIEVPAGLETLSTLKFALKTGVRPPDTKEIAEAFKSFFAQRRGAFEDFHVDRARTAFKYLLENPREDGQPWLSKEELEAGIFDRLMSSASRPETGGVEHLEFGKAILDEVSKTPEKEKEKEKGKSSEVDRTASDGLQMKRIHLLSLFGAASEAKELVTTLFTFDPKASASQREASQQAWGSLLAGLVREGDVEEVQAATKQLQESSLPLTRKMQQLIVAFFAQRQDLESARFWYSQPVVSKAGKEARPLGATSAVLLKACALAGDQVFGQQVVSSLLKGTTLDKGSWDAIFLWSAAIGKGVDEVDRMMGVMIRRNDEARQKNPTLAMIRPDVDTINALVEFSISKQDPYTAERYIALGEKRGILPDEQTFTMQIQYRLSVKDLDGARAAYLNLQGDFSGAERSVAVINQLIQVLCESKQHHFDELMAMVDDLHERKAHFLPETIAALCVLHLQRGEIHDAMDLLQVHAFQFSPEQRSIIQKSLLKYILNGETSTAESWDTYQIMRTVFQETSRDDRVEVMNEFFARKRSDMSCHVFFHLRNHVSEQHSANRDVYVAAFSGFARCADAESLELAHNQLKLDLSVDYDTRLRNSLMLAYAATGENKKALHFWREICESREGPSYNSIAIAFRSCEGMHFGHAHARSIWKRLKEQDVEIDRTIWKAYMCAMARNHQRDEALALIETVEEEYGFKLDLDM
jgi:hypothetical protein